MAAASAQPIPLWENFGQIVEPPQVDAIGFANYGGINIFTELPFTTQNTLNFTNRGSMSGSVGWNFLTVPPVGARRPANSFFNGAGASVEGIEGFGFRTFLIDSDDNIIGAIQEPSASFVVVKATNITSKGLLSVGGDGIILLEGENVDLSRSGLEVGNLIGDGGAVTTNFYINELGVEDIYWGLTNVMFAQSQLWTTNPPIARTPPHRVMSGFFGGGFQQFSLNDPAGFYRSNAISETNVIVQAVFIGGPSGNQRQNADLVPEVRFATAGIGGPATVVARLSLSSSNLVTGVPTVESIYFTDRFLTDTNRVLFTNAVNLTTQRPGNYEISRLQPFDFAFGGSGDSPVPQEILWNDDFTNQNVDAIYSAYAAAIDFLPNRPPEIDQFLPTQLPGRIEIVADELDLTKTRIRGQGAVLISANELVSSSGAVMEAEYLSFDLNSKGGMLNVKDLVPNSIQRVGGSIQAWSGLMTNHTEVVVTNITREDGTDGPMDVTNVATNLVEYQIHVLMLNVDALLTDQQVSVFDFVSRSTHTLLSDPLRVTNRFQVYGDSLTVSSNLTFVGALRSWVNTNGPNLLSFTNTGSVNLPSTANFGKDRATPYDSFVNRGTINAFALEVASGFFQNSGTLQMQGRLDLNTVSAKLDGGVSDFGGDLLIRADNIKLRNYTNATDQTLFLTVTNEVSDAGPGSNVLLSVQDGFHINIANPTGFTGDLLGTTIETTAPRFARVIHSWGAADRGPVPAGFENNAAVARLILSGGFDSELGFAGTGPQNAMYVDFLQLAGFVADDLENTVDIADNLTIYFADASLPVEELDGRLGGRLRWVKDFAGPISGVDVALQDGSTIRVNRGFRESLKFDSDNDGIANGFDDSPFDGVMIRSVELVDVPPLSIAISWEAAAETVYDLEVSSRLINPTWDHVLSFTNSVPTNGAIVTVQDPVPDGSPNRFYRLLYRP